MSKESTIIGAAVVILAFIGLTLKFNQEKEYLEYELNMREVALIELIKEADTLEHENIKLNNDLDETLLKLDVIENAEPQTMHVPILMKNEAPILDMI